MVSIPWSGFWPLELPHLHRLGLLTKVDRAMLAAYCQAWGRHVQAEKILNQRGLTFVTPNGYIQQRPEVTISRKALHTAKVLAAEFGLTPSARSRIEIPRAEPADEFSQYLNRKVANG